MGFHTFIPVETFNTRMICNGIFIEWVVSLTGHQCRCGARKIRKDDGEGQSPGATQEAYDWLNRKPQKAEILTLVKR